MSADDTPPKNRLIATLALVSLCTLVALKFILTSYFNEMVERDKQTKISKPEALYAARAEQQKNLTSSPVPIDQAMADLEKGRPDLIAPKQSDDTGPLVGWAKLPHTLPKAAPPPAPPPTVEAPPADAGAAKDGGKPAQAPTPKGDAGK